MSEMLPIPTDPEWSALAELFADVSGAIDWRLEDRPTFSVRSQITEHLWRLGYRPPPAQS